MCQAVPEEDVPEECSDEAASVPAPFCQQGAQKRYETACVVTIHCRVKLSKRYDF
jgi:hypothetical protein